MLDGTITAGPVVPAVTADVSVLYQKTFDEYGVQVGVAVALSPVAVPSTRPATQDELNAAVALLQDKATAATDAELSSSVASLAAKTTAGRVTTGAIAGAGSVAVVLTLAAAMPDLNYTVAAAVEDVNFDLSVRSVVSKTTTQVTVEVVNNNAVTARTGILHVIAVHD